MPSVLITAKYFAVDPEPVELLRARGCEPVRAELGWALGDGNVSEERAVELLRDVDATIISSLPLTDRVLAQARTLRVIAVLAVGYDSIDLRGATAYGLPVIVAPGFTESVADYTFAFARSCRR